MIAIPRRAPNHETSWEVGLVVRRESPDTPGFASARPPAHLCLRYCLECICKSSRIYAPGSSSFVKGHVVPSKYQLGHVGRTGDNSRPVRKSIRTKGKDGEKRARGSGTGRALDPTEEHNVEVDWKGITQTTRRSARVPIRE